MSSAEFYGDLAIYWFAYDYKFSIAVKIVTLLLEMSRS